MKLSKKLIFILINSVILAGLFQPTAQAVPSSFSFTGSGYGHGVGNPYHNSSAATAIENHVRKKHGNKVADDMVNHSDLHVAHAEYVGPGESKKVEHDAEKLRKKHGIKGDLYGHHEEHTMKEEVVSEAKGPTSQQDDPFVVADNNVPLNNAKTLAAKTMKRMKNEMLGKPGTSE